MKLFTRVLVVGLLGFLVGVPVFGANRGWGLGTERNANIIANSGEFCPAALRLPDGRCRRTHRSYYFGRDVMGGGPHGGK